MIPAIAICIPGGWFPTRTQLHVRFLYTHVLGHHLVGCLTVGVACHVIQLNQLLRDFTKCLLHSNKASTHLADKVLLINDLHLQLLYFLLKVLPHVLLYNLVFQFTGSNMQPLYFLLPLNSLLNFSLIRWILLCEDFEMWMAGY